MRRPSCGAVVTKDGANVFHAGGLCGMQALSYDGDQSGQAVGPNLEVASCKSRPGSPMTSIQPELWVEDAHQALAFYAAAFGATVLLLVGEADDIVAQLGVRPFRPEWEIGKPPSRDSCSRLVERKVRQRPL